MSPELEKCQRDIEAAAVSWRIVFGAQRRRALRHYRGLARGKKARMRERERDRAERRYYKARKAQDDQYTREGLNKSEEP